MDLGHALAKGLSYNWWGITRTCTLLRYEVGLRSMTGGIAESDRQPALSV